MQVVSYIFFRFIVFIISLIPFTLLYLLSNCLSFILKYIIRYRHKVIHQNLNFCFPEKPDTEITAIVNKFYNNFSDVILETIKGFTYNPYKIIPRFKLTNAEILEPYFNKGQSVVLYSQHMINWEWGPICLGLQIKHHIVGVIKKLSNDLTHAYAVKGRAGNNVSVILTHETKSYLANHNPNFPEALVFIADQYPHNKKTAVELDFFGKPVPFHNGAANYAKKLNYPVFVVDGKKIRRGYYALRLYPLHESPADIPSEQLTELYKSHLEDQIRDCPEAWLWSHKRFKNILKY